jgi:polar amino acid transport system substrate-binding protein
MVVVVAASPAAAQLAPTGTLRATFIASNPVQGRVDSQTGATSGPGPDLAREMGRRLAVPVVVTPLADAGAVMASVRDGRADIGFLAYEAARAAQVDFSDPYLLMGSAYAVRADSMFRRTADVDRAGVVIGAVTGQSQEIWVREHVKSARIEATATVPPIPQLAELLLTGKIHAFAANRTRMEELARDYPAIRVLPDNFATVGQAIIVRKGDRARLAEVNRLLSEIRASDFVKSSIDRANLSGVEVAPAPRR